MKSMFQFWWWCLVASCGIMITFGLGMVFAPALMHQFFDQVLFASSSAQTNFDPAANAYIFFSYGILGALLIAWMVPLLSILVGPFQHKQGWAWLAIASSVGIWFAIDSSISIGSGFWQNAVSNVGFLILFAIPLAATYADCNSEPETINNKGLKPEV
jgi:uncharacterized membrane protein YhaH (DUF805 family)